VNHL
jgi:hypothetical protein